MPTPRPRRSDLQGLRAVAMLVVAVYHVWTSKVSGGVDVFLLLSAYFLTKGLVGKVERGEGLGLVRYWARTAARLLAPAVLVIVTTVLLCCAWFPTSAERDLLTQAMASLTYQENFHLAQSTTDYYAQASRTQSPFQHFWSLSFQGQVFLLFPALIGVCAGLARATGWRIRRIAVVAFSAVALASFAWSLHRTATDPRPAYFETWPRVWEMALGALLALGLPSIARSVRIARPVREVMGWAGVAGLLSTGLLLPDTARFPGYAALLPLTCAALVVAAGELGREADGALALTTTSRLLSIAPLRRLGDISYGFYLWHWPVLLTYLRLTERQDVPLLDGLGLLVLSVLLAAATHLLVEKPVARLATGQELFGGRLRGGPTAALLRNATVGLTAVALGLFSVTAWEHEISRSERAVMASGDEDYPGAGVVVGEADPASIPPKDARGIRPSLSQLDLEWSDVGGGCDPAHLPEGPVTYECNTITPAGTPTRRVAVVGDSHARQLLAALRPVAERERWELTLLHRPACRYSGTPSEEADCDTFNSQARQWVLDQKPDAVVVLGTRSFADDRREELVPGLEEGLNPWLEAGIPVVAFHDNPRWATSRPDCVDRHGPGSPRCTAPRTEKLSDEDLLAPLLQKHPDLHGIDLSDLMCPDGACPAVIGNVLVYLDDSHLSASYIRTMEGPVRSRMLAALGWASASGTSAKSR